MWPFKSSRSSAVLVTIHTSHLFDPKSKTFLSNQSIQVNPSTGLIVEIHERKSTLPAKIEAPDVDLRGKTVLPGFVDAHTHIFLHAYAENAAVNQIRFESAVERILRAANHCRAALLAGYTTYRDLGSEGLGDDDVGFRDAVNRGIVPGPRLYVATECIASSGGYEVRQERSANPGPRLSDPADGVAGVRAAVRRRIAAGADVVKIYADYPKKQLRFPPPHSAGCPSIQFPPSEAERNPNIPLFVQEELDAMVKEARVSKAPVSAHATCPEAVVMAAKAGVTTVEHGNQPSDKALRAMKDHGTIFVPTLAAVEQFLPRDGTFEETLAHTKKAYDLGIKLAAGGDTGAFAHGDNAREMELMVEAGIPVVDVLQAATLHGWEACGGMLCGRKFGYWDVGAAADIIALDGDPTKDLKALRNVVFVMKDGKVYKDKGIATIELHRS
jgi:imidazolonepropionase-like amidohydrolase